MLLSAPQSNQRLWETDIFEVEKEQLKRLFSYSMARNLLREPKDTKTSTSRRRRGKSHKQRQHITG